MKQASKQNKQFFTRASKETIGAHRDLSTQTWKSSLYDDRLFDDRLFDNRLFDDRLFDDRLFDDRLFDNRLFDNRLFDDCLFDDRLFASVIKKVKFFIGGRVLITQTMFFLWIR